MARNFLGGHIRGVRMLLVVGLALACSSGCSRPVEPEPPPAVRKTDSPAGAPKLGPGERFNACERIWCIRHEANFALDHFDADHVGWIVHDDAHGDVFAPRGRTDGPPMPHAHTAMLRLCGRHVHPWILERRKGPLRKGGWNAGLGYGRGHFQAYGTRLEPCCANGLGWGFLHAASPDQFRLRDVSLFREAPGIGWQKPYRTASASP